MKPILQSSDFVFSGLEKGRRIRAICSAGALALFFVLSGFTFMNFLYCFADCIGSIVCASFDIALRDALRSVPIFFSFFMALSGLLVAQSFYRNESEAALRRQAKKHAAIGAIIGAVTIVYVVVMRIAGRYLSLVEGAPSALYPLDAVIWSLFFIALGVCVWLYFGGVLKLPAYTGPARSADEKGRFGGRLVRTLWLLIALYGFCGFFYGLFIVDFSVGYLPYSLAVLFVSLVAFLTLAVRELFYYHLTEEKRRTLLLPLSLVSLVVSVAAAAFYFIALGKNLDGPSNVGFGILPVAFAASVNIATLLVVATPLIVSVVALVKGLLARRKG